MLAVVFRARGLPVSLLLLLGVLSRDYFRASAGGIRSLLSGSCQLEKTDLGGSQCLPPDQWVTLGSRWDEWTFCSALKSAIASPLRELLRTEPTYLGSRAYQVEIESGQERGRQNESRMHLQASWTDWIAALCKAARAPRVAGPHVCFSWRLGKRPARNSRT